MCHSSCSVCCFYSRSVVEEFDLEKQLTELVPVKVKSAYINFSPNFIFCCFLRIGC
jgi:hypothetical protein